MRIINTNTLENTRLLCDLLSKGQKDLESIDFDKVDRLALIELANRNFLNFGLYYQLDKKGLLEHFNEEEADYLRDYYELNKKRNADFLSQLEDIIILLNQNSIEPLLLKGSVALLEGWYEGSGERFLRDVDLLVREEQARQAFEILLTKGFSLVNPLDKDLSEIESHQLPALHKERSAFVVEIHTQPVTVSANLALTAKEVWNEAQEIPFNKWRQGGELKSFMPSPEHCLLIALIHTEIADNNWKNYKIFLRHTWDIVNLIGFYQEMDYGLIKKALEKANYIGLWENYFFCLAYFFRSISDEALEDDSTDNNRPYLERVLEEIEFREFSGVEVKRKELILGKLKKAFSEERIRTRYGVKGFVWVNFYRIVNVFRLIVKYQDTQNRDMLGDSIHQELNLNKKIDS